MEMNLGQKIKGEDKGRNSNTSDASNADIPEEIQIEILSRLPPESLSRCKCVSKHWNDTLTIQAFLVRQSRSYDKHSKLVFAVCPGIWGKNSVLSFEPNDDKTPKSTCPVIRGRYVYFADFMSKNIYTSDICNDLICLFKQSSTRVGLLNVRTRDFIRLPAITMKSMRAFRSWYALGFDPVHKVFKVLSIIYGNTRNECRITKAAVLTIGSKYWKQIDYKSLLPPMLSTNKSICLDGVIYWVHKNRIDNASVLTVVAFYLNHETFRDYELVVIPIKDGTFKYYLTSVKGCPTLLIRKTKSDEIQQWTLFNSNNQNAANWNRRSFTAHDFPTKSSYDDYHWTSGTGGSILFRNIMSEIQDLMEPQKGDDSERSYSYYNLEKLAVETE